MFHVYVGPDYPRKGFVTKSNTVFPFTPHSRTASTALSFDNFGNILGAFSFHPHNKPFSASDEMTATASTKFFDMESHVRAHGQFSNVHNKRPNEMQSTTEMKEEQYGHWPVSFSPFKSGRDSPHNEIRSRSVSHSPDQQSIGCSSTTEAILETPFMVQEVGGSGDPASVLIHPIPRHWSYISAGHLAPLADSQSVPESKSAFSLATTSPHEEHMQDGSRSLYQARGWANSDLGYPVILQNKESPDTSSTVTERCTSINSSTGTDGISHPWPTLGHHQIHFEQPPEAVQYDQDDDGWTETKAYPSFDQQADYFNQSPASHCHINGLPWPDNGDQTPLQPSTVLDPGRILDPTSTFETEQSHEDLDLSQLQQISNEIFIYPKDFPAEHYPNTLSESNEGTLHQLRQATQSPPYASDDRNAFLIECKRRGLSYKDIKRIGGFKEAESTLRGRFRTLTKTKDQRVRRPQWQEKDIQLLCEAVDVCAETGRRSHCVSLSPSRGAIQPPKVSWKKVAQYIWAHGGSYHYGNATCKKKWCEMGFRA
ncbi:hypothetical protein P175DRAFT_0527345 [Aspergillus ochraceoroseus IBT 24754]|uniref:Myb-like domain-containing protein n=1 Tax=Aspergillus ochraceoroseus IBT 24754 TaxID=1392256 RepID=A0A2T5M5S1_9EURO|nr:uncharacterized protein P175DRAFT_0527345 [Aspergillus ochraceoroseus IBT 24754]PTU23885.1 hypothetical protein P175DRAFT_0527345 [Aspergillus ochraceoroseus IBT 24754]